MFRYIFQSLAALSIGFIAIFTVIFTYQQVIGFLIAAGLVVPSAPISAWVLGLCIGIAFSFGWAFLPQSVDAIWNKCSNWGNRLDIALWSWWTGKKYYLDEANALLKEGNKHIHAAEDKIDILLRNQQDWRNTSVKLFTDPKEMLEMDQKILAELDTADRLLGLAKEKLRGQDPADPESSAVDRKAGDAVRQQKFIVVDLRAKYAKLKKQYMRQKLHEPAKSLASYAEPVTLFSHKQRPYCARCARPTSASLPDLSRLGL